MPKLTPELEKAILDNIYIGNTKLIDLTQSGRLMSVGFCKECDHHVPPLKAVVNGEVKEITSMRCPYMGFTQPNGWCYHFGQNGKNLFLDADGYLIQ